MAGSTSYIVVVLLSLTASVSITVFRFWSRSHSQYGFQWSLSDSVLLLSLVLQAWLAGIGIRLLSVPETTGLEYQNKMFYIATFAYLSTLWSIKLSISIFYLRLTRRVDRENRHAVYCLFLTGTTFIIAICLQIFGCLPMSDIWIGACNPTTSNIIFWVTVTLNIGTDAILFILPFPTLLLIIEKRIRIAVSAVFGLAALAVIVSLIRAFLVSRSSVKDKKLIIILSSIEVATGVVISAIPEVSRSFTRKYLQGTEGSRNGTGVASNSGRRTHQNTDGAIGSLSGSKLKKGRFVGLRSESTRELSGHADVIDLVDRHTT